MDAETRNRLKQEVDARIRATFPNKPAGTHYNLTDPDTIRRKVRRQQLLADQGFVVLDDNMIKCIECEKVSNKYLAPQLRHLDTCSKRINST